MSIAQAISIFFAKLDTKDVITLVASLSALTVSIMSYRQKSNEGRMALRKQLTDLIEKITELNTEAAIFRVEPEKYPSNYIGLINDKRRFLVRQASFLMESIDSLVSPYEYLVVAGSYDDIADNIQAEVFFKKAIISAHNPIDKGITTRGYARYMFNQGPSSHNKARDLYTNAVEHFKIDNDRYRIYLGDTYVRWGNQEKEWGNNKGSIILFRKAKSVFETLENIQRRNKEIEIINETINENKKLLGES